ncbi:hypothetical protein BE11_34405 [Sorangium cellulosum]|nr:hypothetical protein BE11_34405 [Sorangium cellulosum]
MNEKTLISERALRFLAENGCMPPGWRREALVEWLVQHGAPEFGILIAWEQALYDIRTRYYLARSSCAASAKGCRVGRSNYLLLLESGLRYWTMRLRLDGEVPPVREHEGATFVLFGESSVTGHYYYMDESGRVFGLGPPNLSRWEQVASSAFVQLERAILESMSLKAEAQLRCQGNVAEELAGVLGIPLLPEASDDIEQVCADGRFIVQHRDPRYTDVFILSLDHAPLLLRALKQLDLRAFLEGPTWTRITFEPLEPARELVEPAGEDVVRLWSFGGIRGSVSMDGGALVQTTGRRTEVRRHIVGRDDATEMRRCLVSESELGMFSPRARKYLIAANARRDPIEVPEADELARMLAAWGLPSYPALVDFHATWGGFAWGGAETPNQLGTFGLLLAYFPEPDPPLKRHQPGSPRDVSLDWNGRELVMIGATASTTMYLDHDGSIVEHDAQADQLFPSASRIATRIEFEALLENVTVKQYLERACAGSVGRQLADALGLVAVPEATDAVRSWWIGEHVSVNECYSPISGERMTAIFADDEALHEQAMQLGKSFHRAQS